MRPRSGKASSVDPDKHASSSATGPTANGVSKRAASERPPAQALPDAPGKRAASEPAPAQAAPDAREDTLATRDVARLLRYGERFGTERIDIRMLPLQLHVRSGSLAVFDPGAPTTWHVFEQPSGSGAFRVMLSIARPDESEGGAAGDAARERLAAVVIHVGRPPIAKWIVARFRDQDGAVAADALPRTSTSSGWLALLDASDGAPGVLALPPVSGVTPIEVPLTDGRRALALPCGNGRFAAYWAIDAADRPICIAFDFDVFTQKAWKAKPAT